MSFPGRAEDAKNQGHGDGQAQDVTWFFCLRSRRPSRYRPSRVLPDLLWCRVIGGSMEDVDPYESVAATRRDYQELLMSFRQVVEERNALLCEVARLLSRREDDSDYDQFPVQRRAG
jgi:hypothetical protein